MPDAIAIDQLQHHSDLESIRSGFDRYLTDIREFVRPAASDFYNTGSSITPPSTNARCYDSTALWAAEQLASGYAGFLTPSNDRWADIVLDANRVATYEEQMWLDNVSDILFKEFGNAKTRFVASMQEDYLDLAAFGTSHLYMEYNYRMQRLQFRAYGTGDVWIEESADGEVDVHHRSTTFTTRQLYQQFNQGLLDSIEQVFKDKMKQQRTWEVLHIVKPNTDAMKNLAKVNKKYVSLYILVETKDTLQAKGFSYYPYITGREKVVSGQVYGQSNAFTHLPAIKMVNAMMKTVIKAANKSIDPPVMAPSDGFLVPLSADPGAVWWYDAQSMAPDAIKQFGMQGNFQISDAIIEEIRGQITRGFHVDWLIRNKKNERQTATEIMDDRDEMLRQLSPTLGRLEADKISQIVTTAYYLLNKAGRIPLAPVSLQKSKVKIRFQSPTARAQFGARGADVQRYINEITPMVNVWPSMLDTINPDELSQYLAKIRNIPAVVLNDEKQIAAKREADAQAQQEQQAIDAAPALSRSMKDMAQAQEITGA